MFTVRFPNGFSIQYNTAGYAKRDPIGFTDLYTVKDGTWIAQVPTAGCIIESVRACRVYDAAEQPDDSARAVAEALEGPNRGTLSTHQLKRIKLALRSFNAHTERWK